MKKEKNPASPGSYARLGLIVSNGVIDAVDGQFSKDEMKQLLGNEAIIREIAKKATAEILGIPILTATIEQQKVVKFYKEVFNLDIDVTGLPPTNQNLPAIGYIDSRLTGSILFTGMCHPKVFGEKGVYKNDFSQNIDKIVCEQQARPKNSYWFCHKGGVEPDTEHLNKSYNDFYQDGNMYMTPYEGIITAMRYKYETGQMLDIKGVTRLHGLVHGGCVIRMRRDSIGQFGLGWGYRGDRNSDYGPRQVNF